MIKKILRKDIKLSLLNIRWCRIMQGVVLLSGLAVNAQNPIIQTSYTADPAPMVYNDKLYLYTSHDEDGSTWFTMNDWKLYSTDDMVNWTEHPTLLSFKTFEWAGGDAWAAQCIERDGKFYMYVPVTDRKGETAIGVAVADSPYGPFYDPIGAPLVRADYGNIDPTVFIDEDGQAYLYWGNPNCYYVKLNKDMISYKGEIHAVPMKPEAFGRREGDPQRPTLYEEAPWLYKRKGMYYLFYAGGPVPEHLAYATAESPEGLAANIFLGNYYYLMAEQEKKKLESDYKKLSSPTKMQYARYRDGLSKLFATGYEKARSSLQKVVLRFPSTEAQKTLDKILRIEKEVNR